MVGTHVHGRLVVLADIDAELGGQLASHATLGIIPAARKFTSPHESIEIFENIFGATRPLQMFRGRGEDNEGGIQDDRG